MKWLFGLQQCSDREDSDHKSLQRSCMAMQQQIGKRVMLTSISAGTARLGKMRSSREQAARAVAVLAAAQGNKCSSSSSVERESMQKQAVGCSDSFRSGNTAGACSSKPQWRWRTADQQIAAKGKKEKSLATAKKNGNRITTLESAPRGLDGVSTNEKSLRSRHHRGVKSQHFTETEIGQGANFFIQ